ncbi:hypothetical protein JTE90_006484 [Oedothorax gibbosus]|uniref:Uncharacterized protein n=1 Tax=Oedothorax gibbosus TaxID=931172 RepID=A0AAV6VP23_9ARAC|nr:hypothetical protein JTE90_006484 [Oedothorax gibbosus]
MCYNLFHDTTQSKMCYSLFKPTSPKLRRGIDIDIPPSSLNPTSRFHDDEPHQEDGDQYCGILLRMPSGWGDAAEGCR